MLSHEQAARLLKCINDGYKVLQSNGCAVTDARTFIEVTICKEAGLGMEATNRMIDKIRFGNDLKREED